MVDKNSILIMYYRDGESKSSISRELKLSRKTVRKYIEEHEQKQGSVIVSEHLEKGMSSRPKYDVSSRSKVKLTRDVAEEVNYCIEKNNQKRNQGLRKQIMKKIDIHEYLLSKGYEI